MQIISIKIHIFFPQPPKREFFQFFSCSSALLDEIFFITIFPFHFFSHLFFCCSQCRWWFVRSCRVAAKSSRRKNEKFSFYHKSTMTNMKQKKTQKSDDGEQFFYKLFIFHTRCWLYARLFVRRFFISARLSSLFAWKIFIDEMIKNEKFVIGKKAGGNLGLEWEASTKRLKFQVGESTNDECERKFNLFLLVRQLSVFYKR